MRNLLSGISKANSALLEEEELDISLNKVIAELGASTNVDRCYIFTNRVENGHLIFDYTHEWCALGIDEYFGNPDLSGVSYDFLPSLFENLSQKNVLYGLVSESKNIPFKQVMEMQGILTYLFVPIFCKEVFWGWMGYDECRKERNWLIEEVDAINAVARNIGLRLSREKVEADHNLAIERFDLSVRGSQQGLWEWDITNGSANYSSIFMSMIGYKHFEFEHNYENWQKLMHPNDYLVVRPKIEAYLRKEIPEYTAEFRLQHKDGYYVWIKGSGVAKWNEHGTPVFMVGSHLDISELKQQQENLETQRNEFNKLLNSLGEAVFRLNIQNEITYLNSYWEHLTGYEIEYCIGKKLMYFFTTEDSKLILHNIESLRNDEQLTSLQDVRLIEHNNEVRWVQMILKEFGKPTDKDYFVAGSIIDIHDKKLASQKEKELAELKSGFVSLASHQFRTPLTVIYSNVELIEFYTAKHDIELFNTVQSSSTQIKEEIKRMTELMNNILLVGRYEANQLHYHLKPVLIISYINGIIETYFSNQADKRKILVHYNVDNDVLLSIDTMLFTHVLTNIISNAFKYSMGKKNPVLTVEHSGIKINLIVEDYGIGIPENEVNKVFDSFYRATNTTTLQGTGLGLVVAKQFIELHNGTIELESKLGVGTKVTLTLPINKVD